MRVVILAGGLGTRLAEETEVKPKPMVEIGDRPILWHILKYYAHYDFKDFYIAMGYKSDVIKRYFVEYHALNGNMRINLADGTVQAEKQFEEDWIVNLVDTGLNTATGGRLKRLEPALRDATFMVTYGDGVSDVNLHDLLNFHRRCGRLATITAVRPPSRFGGLTFDGDLVAEFTEKPQIGEGWINGGFLVLEPQVLSMIEGDQTNLEAHVLERLAAEGQLAAYRHDRFWQCMDTLRDLRVLTSLWQSGTPPWKLWK